MVITEITVQLPLQFPPMADKAMRSALALIDAEFASIGEIAFDTKKGQLQPYLTVYDPDGIELDLVVFSEQIKNLSNKVAVTVMNKHGYNINAS